MTTIEALNKLRTEEIEKSKDYLNEDLRPIPQEFDIIETSVFKKQLKRLGFTEEDVEELKIELKKRPPKASLGNGAYKFEWHPSRFNLGKKESRVCYIEVIRDSKAWLVYIYSKNDKKDLTNSEKKDIKELSKQLNKKR